MAELGLTALVGLALVSGLSIALLGMTLDLGMIAMTLMSVLPGMLAITLLWVVIAALASWPLRRGPQWLSLAAGLCASLILSAIVFGPVWFRVAATDGWRGGSAQFSVIVSIALPLVVLAIQAFVDLVLRARRRSDVGPNPLANRGSLGPDAPQPARLSGPRR
jgi:hypothetical protein